MSPADGYSIIRFGSNTGDLIYSGCIMCYTVSPVEETLPSINKIRSEFITDP